MANPTSAESSDPRAPRGLKFASRPECLDKSRLTLTDIQIYGYLSIDIDAVGQWGGSGRQELSGNVSQDFSKEVNAKRDTMPKAWLKSSVMQGCC